MYFFVRFLEGGKEDKNIISNRIFLNVDLYLKRHYFHGEFHLKEVKQSQFFWERWVIQLVYYISTQYPLAIQTSFFKS